MSAIDRRAEFQALRNCGTTVINARDGRGRHGARQVCIRALKRAGHTPAAAEQLAHHTDAWAAGFARHAAELVARYIAEGVAHEN